MNKKSLIRIEFKEGQRNKENDRKKKGKKEIGTKRNSSQPIGLISYLKHDCVYCACARMINRIYAYLKIQKFTSLQRQHSDFILSEKKLEIFFFLVFVGR